MRGKCHDLRPGVEACGCALTPDVGQVEPPLDSPLQRRAPDARVLALQRQADFQSAASIRRFTALLKSIGESLDHPAEWASGSPIPLGLNTTHFGRLEEQGSLKWGSDDEQADDVARLGATIIRHVAFLDLDWRARAYDTSTGAVRRVPAQGDVGSVLIDETSIDRFVKRLDLLHQRGIRAVLTCIMYGGDRDTCVDAGRLEDPDCPQIPGQAEAWEFPWDAVHSTRIENLDYLDAQSGYQTSQLVNLAVVIAEFLHEVQAQVRRRLVGSYDLGETIEGLEVFDYIDDRNVVFARGKVDQGDAIVSGLQWGSLFVEVARALQQRLSMLGLDIPVRLPGLSPDYQAAESAAGVDGISRNSLEYSLTFLDAFLHAVSGYAGEAAIDISAALHFHWDHRGLKSSNSTKYPQLGPRHIASIVGDVAAMRRVLDARGFEHTTISVLRSGVSIADPDEYTPTWASPAAEWRRSGSREVDSEFELPAPWAGRELFQAYEVWRRLGGALAAGVDSAGWDTWMALYSSAEGEAGREFWATGLRLDTGSPRTPASVATQRSSCYAFRRFTEQLGETVSAKMLWPSPPDDVGYAPVNDTDFVVIIEFVIGSVLTRRFAYLLLIDPTLDVAAGAARYCARPRSRGAFGPDEWEEIQTLPLSLPTTTRTGSDAELPLAEIDYLPNAVGPIPDAVVVTTGDYVRLFTSQARLAWDVVACTPIEPPKAVIERSFDGLPKDAPSFVPPDLNGPTR